jgi:hypothetical protein
MLVRLRRPGEDALADRLDAHVRRALAPCWRCTDIYHATGLIPVACHICQADRDGRWLAALEARAQTEPCPETPAARNFVRDAFYRLG